MPTSKTSRQIHPNRTETYSRRTRGIYRTEPPSARTGKAALAVPTTPTTTPLTTTHGTATTRPRPRGTIRPGTETRDQRPGPEQSPPVGPPATDPPRARHPSGVKRHPASLASAVEHQNLPAADAYRLASEDSAAPPDRRLPPRGPGSATATMVTATTGCLGCLLQEVGVRPQVEETDRSLTHRPDHRHEQRSGQRPSPVSVTARHRSGGRA